MKVRLLSRFLHEHCSAVYLLFGLLSLRMTLRGGRSTATVSRSREMVELSCGPSNSWRSFVMAMQFLSLACRFCRPERWWTVVRILEQLYRIVSNETGDTQVNPYFQVSRNPHLTIDLLRYLFLHHEGMLVLVCSSGSGVGMLDCCPTRQDTAADYRPSSLKAARFLASLASFSSTLPVSLVSIVVPCVLDVVGCSIHVSQAYERRVL